MKIKYEKRNYHNRQIIAVHRQRSETSDSVSANVAQ